MVQIGVILLVYYLVCFSSGGIFSKTEEKLNEKEEHTPQDVLKLFGIVVFLLTISILLFVFFIKAVAVDIYTYPSLIALTWLVGSNILAIIGDKKPPKYPKLETRIFSFICIVYILYILNFIV